MKEFRAKLSELYEDLSVYWKNYVDIAFDKYFPEDAEWGSPIVRSFFILIVVAPILVFFSLMLFVIRLILGKPINED